MYNFSSLQGQEDADVVFIAHQNGSDVASATFHMPLLVGVSEVWKDRNGEKRLVASALSMPAPGSMK